MTDPIKRSNKSQHLRGSSSVPPFPQTKEQTGEFSTTKGKKTISNKTNDPQNKESLKNLTMSNTKVTSSGLLTTSSSSPGDLSSSIQGQLGGLQNLLNNIKVNEGLEKIKNLLLHDAIGNKLGDQEKKFGLGLVKMLDPNSKPKDISDGLGLVLNNVAAAGVFLNKIDLDGAPEIAKGFEKIAEALTKNANLNDNKLVQVINVTNDRLVKSLNSESTMKNLAPALKKLFTTIGLAFMKLTNSLVTWNKEGITDDAIKAKAFKVGIIVSIIVATLIVAAIVAIGVAAGPATLIAIAGFIGLAFKYYDSVEKYVGPQQTSIEVQQQVINDLAHYLVPQNN